MITGSRSEYDEMIENVRLRLAGQGLYEAHICRSCGDRLPDDTNTHLDCWASKKQAEGSIPMDVR